MKSKIKRLSLIDAVFPIPFNRTLISARNIVLIFSFAILTGICAKLKIEIGPVPVTMQTFAVLLSGALLGSSKGAFSQLTYLIFGLLGIPLFSRGGGIVYILSPTFGYIIGFVFAAYIVGYLCERGWDKNLKTAILAMLIGNVSLYIPGLLWLSNFVGLKNVLAIGFYPFLIGDLLKIILAALLLPSALKFIK